MSFDPILTAPFWVQIHLAFVAPALVIGPVALFRHRRDRLHKWVGYTFALLLTGLAITGFLIPADEPVIGVFGPIHLLSVLTLYGVAQGVATARRGQIAAHRMTMASLWFGALGVAGLFTLLPGRRLHAAFLAPADIPAAPVIAGGIALLILVLAVFWPGRRGLRFSA